MGTPRRELDRAARAFLGFVWCGLGRAVRGLRRCHAGRGDSGSAGATAAAGGGVTSTAAVEGNHGELPSHEIPKRPAQATRPAPLSPSMPDCDCVAKMGRSARAAGSRPARPSCESAPLARTLVEPREESWWAPRAAQTAERARLQWEPAHRQAWAQQQKARWASQPRAR